jgi:hypothetical protein
MDVLTNKKYKRYDSISRYTTFPIYYNTLDDKYVYGTTSYLIKNIPYSRYRVNRNDTWDSIALEFYGNPVLYWALCDFNNVQDPFIEPEPGTYINIPVISTLRFNEV